MRSAFASSIAAAIAFAQRNALRRLSLRYAGVPNVAITSSPGNLSKVSLLSKIARSIRAWKSGNIFTAS